VALNLSVRSDCVVMRTNAPRTRSRTRVCKNQKISLHFSRVSSPHPSTAKRKKKWKGNFWFCFAVSVSEKSIYILSYFDCSFLRPHGDRGAPISAFCGSSNVREHTQPPTHSPLAFARAGCFGVVCVRLVASRKCSGDSKKRIVLKHKQICMCLPHPPCARTKNHPLTRVTPLYYFCINRLNEIFNFICCVYSIPIINTHCFNNFNIQFLLETI